MKNYFLAVFTGIAVSVVVGFIIIPILKRMKFGQNILVYVKEHGYKGGTPTMGGFIFIVGSIISFFVWKSGDGHLAIICISVGLAYMLVGFIDDFIKIKLKRNEGLSPIQKTLFELAVAIIIAVFSYSRGLTKAYIPFTSEIVDMGAWFLPVCIIVFIATTNSVNLTDGLDGLAAGTSYVYFAVMATLIICQMNVFSSNYVNISEYRNLITLSFSLVGGLIGYLLFNTYKASVFMGDTGSLSLGGFIAAVSLMSGNVFFIPLIGITYVCSSISVILQVAHFKRTGKRIFLMAPLHHHFQHKGYSESKIVFGYKLITLAVGIICIVFCL